MLLVVVGVAIALVIVRYAPFLCRLSGIAICTELVLILMKRCTSVSMLIVKLMLNGSSLGA